MMDSDMASAIANGESAEQTDGSTTDTIGELFSVKKNELSKNAERITDWCTDLDQKVVRSRTLTEKGKQERIQTLKNKQKTALGNVTKKRNDISRNMCSESNLHLVKSALDDYNDLFMEYQECTQAYCELIDDEQTLADESDRFDNKEMSITSYRSQVESWIYTAERRLADDLENTSRRTSHCSGASRSSRASGRSQVSERTIAKARLAELLAQKDLSQQQAALELQRSALQLDIEIAKVRAREKVFAEAELDSSVVKVEPSDHVVMSGNHGNHKTDVDKKVPLHVNLNDQTEILTFLE